MYNVQRQGLKLLLVMLTKLAVCTFYVSTEQHTCRTSLWTGYSVSCQCDITLLKGSHTFKVVTIPIQTSVHSQVTIREYNL